MRDLTTDKSCSKSCDSKLIDRVLKCSIYAVRVIIRCWHCKIFCIIAHACRGGIVVDDEVLGCGKVSVGGGPEVESLSKDYSTTMVPIFVYATIGSQ